YDKGSISAVYKCGHYSILSHLAAVEEYRKTKLNGKIGLKVDGDAMIPLDPNSKADQQAAFRGMVWGFGWFANPLYKGNYPASMLDDLDSTILPRFILSEMKRLRQNKPDFLGYDGYTTGWARPTKNCKRNESNTWPICVDGIETLPNGTSIGPPTNSPWNFDYPQTLRIGLKHLYSTYGAYPLYITENGMAVVNESQLSRSNALNDYARINWYKGYLKVLKEVIEQDHIPVDGFIAWACLDNFEWIYGYNTRFGLIYVDYETEQRYVKQSARYLKGVFKQGKPI
ncbi:unnamed protein product, partial [Didymodactylos carnosus]